MVPSRFEAVFLSSLSLSKGNFENQPLNQIEMISKIALLSRGNLPVTNGLFPDCAELWFYAILGGDAGLAFEAN
jgi:hypothetical protein